MTKQAIVERGEIKIFLHHIYEYQKGIRSMILCTMDKEIELPFATERLQNLGISFFSQETPSGRANLFFGRSECLDALKLFLGGRSLNMLTPEEDFIVGAMLGYDICLQCQRYCSMKQSQISNPLTA